MIYEDLNNCININLLEGEIWIPISGYEKYYEISNYGRVKRLSFIREMYNQSSSWNRHFPEKLYTLHPDSKGYPQVVLNVDGCERKVVRCHRLVAEHFLEPPSEELVKECSRSGLNYVPVEHEDDDPRNPHVDNLRWCSPSFNSRKCSERNDYTNIQGSNQYMSVLDEEDVLEIVRLLSSNSLSQKKIGEMFGVKQITISNIKTGRSWSHLTGINKTQRSRKRKPKAIMEREEKQTIDTTIPSC